MLFRSENRDLRGEETHWASSLFLPPSLPQEPCWLAHLRPCHHLWCVRRCGQSLRLSGLQRDHLFLGLDIGCHGQETFSWPQDIYPRDMAFPPYLAPLQGEPSPGAPAAPRRGAEAGNGEQKPCLGELAGAGVRGGGCRRTISCSRGPQKPALDVSVFSEPETNLRIMREAFGDELQTRRGAARLAAGPARSLARSSTLHGGGDRLPAQTRDAQLHRVPMIASRFSLQVHAWPKHLT